MGCDTLSLPHMFSEIESHLEDVMNREAGTHYRQGRFSKIAVPSTQMLYNTLAAHEQIVKIQVNIPLH